MNIYPDFFRLCNEWTDFFYDKEVEEILENVNEQLKLKTDITIYPAVEDVFTCFYLTPLKSIKVVIIGQDPYHNGSATGLCFDVKTGQIINPSLQNIYKELESEGHYPTKNGDLKHWAKQGVLLINSALTVEKGSPESHLEIWSAFFEKVLEKLSEREFIVWALFGKKAADYKKHITHPLHPIVETTHPSPFSAMKASSSQPAFMGSGVFNTINKHLYHQNIEKIAW